MTDPASAQRRYGEEEIGRILKRATEIQLTEPSSAGAAGMTLQELEASRSRRESIRST